jgi:hypothetical protein
MKIILFWILLVNAISTYSQNIVEIQELNTYEVVAGPNFGYSGEESPQWKLYNIILEKYTPEIIENEYFMTKSIITKLYLYWILREWDWHNLSIIFLDLVNYKDSKVLFGIGGCIVLDSIEIGEIINFNYNNNEYYTNENYENDFYKYFDPSISHKINALLYEEMMLEYLNLPYLDIELSE